jgi:UDP-N-acetyl-2-amino-2-deoxyglucuronate dehydrogenase
VIRHVGILGGGSISEAHARAAAAVPDLRVVAVCGRDPSRVEALAGRYGAAAFTDVQAFLRHRPMEIVAIGTPSGVHADHVEAAAAQGLHVVCEKPLDISTARIDRMLAAVERAGITLGVFFQDRSTPDLMDVKDALVAGRLGRPILADARVKWYRPPEYYAQSLWRGTWALDGGGALMNQGIHTVDLLLWLLGDVRRVYARTLAALHAIEVEDTAVAVLEFANGAVATLEATTAAWPGYDRRVSITGTLGTVVIEQARVAKWDLREPALEGAAGGAAAIVPSDIAASVAGPSASTHVVADASAHRRVFEDFVSALDTGRPPRVDGREGRRSVALIEAIYASSRSGQPVDVTPDGRR